MAGRLCDSGRRRTLPQHASTKRMGREEDVAGRAFVDALASPDHELEPFTSGNAIYRKLSRYSPPVYVNRYNHNVAIVR
jgi:hypothetical protein